MLAIPLAAALLVLAGCSENPVTGRSEFVVVSEEQAIESSAAAYREMIGQLEKKNRVESGTPCVARVRAIAERLIPEAVRLRPAAAKWSWEVKVIDEPKNVNAFAMAGGKIAVYSGMWETLKATDDELAQVLRHEIGHAIAAHTRERISIAMGTGLVTSIAGAVVASRNPELGELALQGTALAAALAVTLPNSRQSESEADAIGIELAARAGFDPQAAVTLWEKMGRAGGAAPPEFLSTHPSPDNRRERLRALAGKLQPVYQAAKRG
jgi:predicted Zn-dependent protease